MGAKDNGKQIVANGMLCTLSTITARRGFVSLPFGNLSMRVDAEGDHMTTVLLDTNVLIELEDAGRSLAEGNARMLRDASRDVDFYVHPYQYRDIARDKNEDRRMLLLSRIARYRVLDEPPWFDDAHFESGGWANKTDNDRIENTLLACVVESVVDFLLTRDKRIIANSASPASA